MEVLCYTIKSDTFVNIITKFILPFLTKLDIWIGCAINTQKSIMKSYKNIFIKCIILYIKL